MKRLILYTALIISALSFGQSFDFYDSLYVNGVTAGNRIDPSGWGALWQVKTLISEGDLTKADEELLVVFNDQDLVSFQNNLRGEIALRYSDYTKSLMLFEHALSMCKHPKLKTMIITNLGLCYLTLGNQDKASEYLNQGLSSNNILYGPSSLHAAAAHNNLGLVYTSSRPKKSIIEYKKAANIYSETLGFGHVYEGIISTNVALVFQAMGTLDSALVYGNKSLVANKRRFGPKHQATVFSKSLIGQIHLANHDYLFADAFLSESIGQLEELYDGRHGEIASLYNILAKSKTEQHDYEEAMIALDKALVANSKKERKRVLSGLPYPIASYLNQDALLQTLYERGVVYEQLYFKRNLKKRDLVSALQYYKWSVELVDELRHQRVSASDKLRLSSISRQIFTQALGVCYTLNSTSLKKSVYLDDAFYFIEKGKASVLQESIADAQAKSFAGLPDSILIKEEALKSEISFLSNKQAKGAMTRGQLTDLFELRRSLDLFLSDVEKKFPKYHELKYKESSIGLEEFQEVLNDGELAINYFIGENGSLYKLIIDAESCHLEKSQLPDEFSKQISGLRNTITYQVESGYVNTAHSLYDVLIPQLKNHVKNVIVLADGEIGLVPFAALLKSTKGEGYSTYDYFVNNVSLKYHLSGQLFVEARAKESQELMKAGLYTPVSYGAFGLKKLEGAEQEQDSICMLLNSYETHVLIHTEATETCFKENSSDYGLIHLPTHGVVDQRRPQFSRVYLVPDSANDGILYVGEIYGLQLNADLVVLSACQTGLGRIAKGEGVIGLSRALVYSGARNLMVSYWTVSDQATSRLMTSFYRNRLVDQGVSEPLRKAQLKLIHSEDFSAPYFWASFFEIGEE